MWCNATSGKQPGCNANAVEPPSLMSYQFLVFAANPSILQRSPVAPTLQRRESRNCFSTSDVCVVAAVAAVAVIACRNRPCLHHVIPFTKGFFVSGHVELLALPSSLFSFDTRPCLLPGCLSARLHWSVTIKLDNEFSRLLGRRNCL